MKKYKQNTDKKVNNKIDERNADYLSYICI